MSYERILASPSDPLFDKSNKPFLQSCGDEAEPNQGSLYKLFFFPRLQILAVHACVALLYITLFTAVGFSWINGQRCYRSTGKYMPAQEAIEYELKSIEPKSWGNPFVGDPRPDHDKAWSDILRNTHIRLSKEELQKLNRTSIALKDGSGYIAELGVYHELHCVKWIRKWIYRDHYWPALKGAMLEERKGHIDHCLEYFRLNAMCHGSQAITTFEWLGSQPRPVSQDQRECVNWEKLDAWSSERRVNLYDLDALADRPSSQDWELIDHDLRLGVKEGDVKGFSEVIENLGSQM